MAARAAGVLRWGEDVRRLVGNYLQDNLLGLALLVYADE
jgi:hypothetical protein